MSPLREFLSFKFLLKERGVVGARGFEPRSAGFSGSELQRLIPKSANPLVFTPLEPAMIDQATPRPRPITLKPTPIYKLYYDCIYRGANSTKENSCGLFDHFKDYLDKNLFLKGMMNLSL